jgi:hypothetical protein
LSKKSCSGPGKKDQAVADPRFRHGWGKSDRAVT